MIGVWYSRNPGPTSGGGSRRPRRAQLHVALHLFAAQVEVAIAQPRFLGVFLIAKHHQRQLAGRAQHFDVADEDLDLAGRDLGVHQLGVARLHVAVDADAPFRAHLFHVGEHRAVGIAEHLRHAVVIAQVDEQNAAVVADAVDPAGQADGFADVGLVSSAQVWLR